MAWKKESTGRVLELQGARQVGKTYILKKFGKENFSKMVYINMAENTGKNFLRCISIAMEWEPGKPMEETPVRKALELYDETFKDNKDTVVVIEHNLDVIKVADYIIDLGPEGGDVGGQIVACGTPEEVAKVKESYTGQFLNKML